MWVRKLRNDSDITDVRSLKYVGDIISENGKIDENIADRRAKGFGIVSDILSILEEIPLGTYRIEAGLEIRDVQASRSRLQLEPGVSSFASSGSSSPKKTK